MAAVTSPGGQIDVGPDIGPLPEASKRAMWARVFIVAGALVAGASRLVVAEDDRVWVTTVVAAAAVALAFLRFPDHTRWAVGNRLGLIASAGAFLLYRGTIEPVGPAPVMLATGSGLILLGTLLLPSSRQGRGGRVGAVIVGGVLALAIAGLMAITLETQGSPQAVSSSSPAAEANLAAAYEVATDYFDRGDTYRGFDPRAATKLDGDRSWIGADKSPAKGEVAIRIARNDALLLVTPADAGGFLCIGTQAGGDPRYGASADDILDLDACASAAWPGGTTIASG